MSSQQRLLQLIKASNPLAADLQVSAVDFGAPVALTAETRNTEITLTSKPSSGYVGAVTLRYDRRNLAEFDTLADFVLEDEITVPRLLTQLNAKLHTYLTAEDVLAVDIPTYPAGVIATVTLTAAPTSLEWIGTLDVSVLRTASEQTQIAAVLQAVQGIQLEVDLLEDLVGMGDLDISVLVQARKFNGTTDDFFLGQAVYAVGTLDMALAQANDASKATVVGLVASELVESGGGEGKLQSIGILTGTIAQWEFATGMIGGLAPNQPYFLDPAVKGRITPFRPMEEGAFLTYIGTAISPTQLSINIDRPISL